MKAARFQFQECSEGFQRTRGTKIFTEDGEIHGIVRATIHIEVDDVVRAEVELMPVIDKIEGAETHFVMEHPLKGGFEEVGKIIFADGSEVDFGELEGNSESRNDCDVTDLGSTEREFVRGTYAVIKPPPPADTGGSDLFQEEPVDWFWRIFVRRLFNITERQRWTKAIDRAWFAMQS